MNQRTLLPLIIERGFPILAYSIPLAESIYFFAHRVCLYTNNISLKLLFLQTLKPIAMFYSNNLYAIFFTVCYIFAACSANRLPLSRLLPTREGKPICLNLSKFTRINVMQAILLEIVIAMIGQIWNLSPTLLKNGLFGTFVANACLVGLVGLIVYSSFIIALGRYPRLPIISGAARVQLQGGWLN